MENLYKISFREIMIEMKKTGWIEEEEVDMDEVESFISEAGEVLTGEGFVIHEDVLNRENSYLITPTVENMENIIGYLEEISKVEDELPKGVEKLSPGARDYWEAWMDGHCDDTYYDYHKSYVWEIVDNCISIIKRHI
jgi:hypothetical protein